MNKGIIHIGENRENPLRYNKGFLYIPPISGFQTIVLDWLELFIYINGNNEAGEYIIPTQFPEKTDYFINDDIVLRKANTGTPLYLSRWELFLHGESVGQLCTHPRTIMGPIKERTGSFKLHNHLLYQSGYLDTLHEVFEGLQAEIKSITRLDIAIDGCNDLIPFLNLYTKQSPENKFYHLKGKAKFKPQDQNHNTMTFDGFIVGAGKSEKKISIYCKSAEIETSNKKYIQRFWEKSGMKYMPWEKVYRCEMRLSSKAVNALKDFDITELENPKYLASIFMTHSRNFFQFTHFTDDSNISRQDDFYPLDFSNLGAVYLDKTEAPIREDRYKAKLAIHHNCKLILTGKNRPETGFFLMQDACEKTVMYDLIDWLKKRLPDWKAKYEWIGKVNHEHIKMIESVIEQHEPVHDVA